MPELPEVETIVRQLNKAVKGQKIENIEVKVEKLFKGNPKDIIGEKIIEIDRRSKILIFKLTHNFLLIHLKMTGQLIYIPKGSKHIIVGGHPEKAYEQPLPHKHTHIIFHLSGGTLYFNDMRKFGWAKVLKKEDDLKKEVKDLGPEYNWPEFTQEYLTKALSRRQIPIKTALLNQSIISGLGNIYSDEVLFCASIRPTHKANSLNSKQIKSIYNCIPLIFEEAIRYGGTSKKDYLHITGEKGTYYEYTKIYDKAGRPCKKCKTIVQKVKINGRTSSFCPNCQT